MSSTIEQKIKKLVRQSIQDLYSQEVHDSSIQLQKTNKEFSAHYTVVVFPFLKISKKGPEATANEIGNYLISHSASIPSFTAIKGFLNLVVADGEWIKELNEIHLDERYGLIAQTEQSPLVMIEYSSPNTNKPLHLGHVRNNLLGHSISEILKANGNKVIKTNIVNDRGIHICKSMLAWQKWGNGATPESTGKKGDHLIGDYYVLFDKNFKAEVAALQTEKNITKEEAEAQSPLMNEAREMLRRWEAGDSEVRSLWTKMNDWVYAGFEKHTN